MVKVISLSNEAYERLKALKGRDNSFSDVVVEFVPVKKKNIMDFAGIFEKNAGEWEKIESELINERKKARLKEHKW